MTASVLKQDPNTEKIQNSTIYWGGGGWGGMHFRVNPLYQATKQNLNNN